MNVLALEGDRTVVRGSSGRRTHMAIERNRMLAQHNAERGD